MAWSYAKSQNTDMASKRVRPRFKQPRNRYFFKEWRKFRGLNQEELADLVGVSTAAISQLETGKQGFTGDTLEALAVALHCDPHDLLARNPLDDNSIWNVLDQLRKADDTARETAIRSMSAILKTGTDD